jgi:hypothetical protein
MTRAQIENSKINALQEALGILGFSFEEIDADDFWTLIETDASEDQLDRIQSEL